MQINKVKIAGTGWMINDSMWASGQSEYAEQVQDWIAEGNTPEPEYSSAELKERTRAALQAVRDQSLTSMTHTFSDGSVIQVRPSDLTNFNIAIGVGVDRDWIMADNTVRFTTVAEMQEALSSGISQGQAIWNTYAQELKAL